MKVKFRSQNKIPKYSQPCINKRQNSRSCKLTHSSNNKLEEAKNGKLAKLACLLSIYLKKSREKRKSNWNFPLFFEKSQKGFKNNSQSLVRNSCVFIELSLEKQKKKVIIRQEFDRIDDAKERKNH